MKIAPVADVKAKLSEYITASQKGPVVITKNGKPTAALVAITSDEDLERILLANSPGLQKILNKSARSIAARKGIEHEDFWSEVDAKPVLTKAKRKRV